LTAVTAGYFLFLAAGNSVACGGRGGGSLSMRLASMAAIAITPMVVTTPTITSKTIPK
jgi:hypothetical protein